jgi:hypothetical protein
MRPDIWQVYLSDRRHRQFSPQARARSDGVKSVKDHCFDYLDDNNEDN